ncbi:MAG: PepSY domain-containing protein [Kiloniellales bacterium]|nr:PepSY domain-containing protein [Kiloniellales bacterium]
MATARSVRRWYAVHKWTSLISTLFMLIACVTGLPLVFHEEIDQLEAWLSGEPAGLEAEATARLSIDALAETARQARPDAHLQLLYREPSDPGMTGFSMGETIGAPVMDSEFLRFDDVTGEYRGAERVGEGVMGFFYVLHAELYAGLGGSLFLGVMAIVFLVAIVSGVVLYAPFMRNRAFAVVRITKGRRTRWFDLHNALGIVLLVWTLVVSATGVINTWGSPMIQFWLLNDMQRIVADDLAGADGAGAELTSVQAAIDLAAREMPDGNLSFVAFPGSEFSSDRHYLVFFYGSTPISSRMMKPAIVNAYTGALIATPDLPWYLNVLLLSQPLHFGDYGGIGLKIVWALLGLATVVLLWSGLVLWWRKRDEAPEIDIVSREVAA